MKRLTITGNGTYSLGLPYSAGYTVVYTPVTVNGATMQLIGFDTPLKDGLIVESDQYKIDHGHGGEISLVVTDFVSPFTVAITHGS